MAFDGGFLHKTVDELKSAIDCHIDKIYQPTRDELVFLLRKKGFSKRLLFSIRQGSARIHFTENKYENPASPPNFCMLLRKHLSSAKLIDIIQPNLERLVEFVFTAKNEMGDAIRLRLICELIGNKANVILLKENGIILAALKYSDIEAAKRFILPGAAYEYPLSQEKLNPLSFDLHSLSQKISSLSGEVNKNLLNLVDGFSPIVCREIEYAATTNTEVNYSLLEKKLKAVVDDIIHPTPVFIIYEPNGNALDFCYTKITQYGSNFTLKSFNSCSELLDAFYSQKDTAARIQSAAHDILKLIQNLKKRTEKRLALRLEELKGCENREKLRIYGELLKANLYSIENGSRFALVQNYYDPNLQSIKIPLDPALSPAKNAEKYFKEYKKTYTAEQRLTALTKDDEQELIYLDSVLESISRCNTLAELAQIKEELSLGGYTKSSTSTKAKKTTQPKFTEYTSQEGYKILVGKNNLQNDYITTKLAAKNDLWFHTKNIAGSHVVVFCGGNPVLDETILMAALLAAKNSKASQSSQVPVDYTYIKNVKKPSGAKAGMVIYTTNKTVFVNPNSSAKDGEYI